MNSLESDARVLELEGALEETGTSLSWRLTAPLRRLRLSPPGGRRPELAPRRLSEGLSGADGP
jgi:hypothetical protein